MVALNLSSILAFLKEQKYDAKFQEETNQVYYVQNIGGQEFPVFFRLFEESELLQVIAFIPGMMQPGSQPEVARLLHLLNKELDIPGFGMDEEAGATFYRYMVPALNKEINETMLGDYLKAIEVMCHSFGPVIMAVTQGKATFEEIVKKSKEHEKKLREEQG